MDKDHQKEVWKEESDQLKNDLLSRQKIAKQREVEIKFGGKAPSKSPPPPSPKTTTKDDDLLRQQLGL